MEKEQRHSGQHQTPETLERVEGTRKADREAVSFFLWLETQVKRTTVVGALYLLLASVIGWAGGRLVSPKEQADGLRSEIAMEFSRRDSLRVTLSTELHGNDSVHTTAIREIREELVIGNARDRFQSYVVCIIARRIDASIVPPECAQAVNAYRSPR